MGIFQVSVVSVSVFEGEGMSEQKFNIGQVVMVDRGKKRGIPVKILGIVLEYGSWFYRVDRKNCLSESMIRALTDEEKGIHNGK